MACMSCGVGSSLGHQTAGVVVAIIVVPWHACVCTYAKLQTTVYPSKSTPIPLKLRQNPFQTIPNKLFFGRKQIWSAIFFQNFGLLGTFTALERSENGLGRSGIIRRHSEMTWNAWNSLTIIKNHSKIMRKHLKIDQKSSMGTKGLRV